jgi:hypothetical protein
MLDLGYFFNFLILYTAGESPWTEDHIVARPLPTHSKSTQANTLWAEFEPTIPVFEREKTVHAIDLGVTVVGLVYLNIIKSKSEIINIIFIEVTYLYLYLSTDDEFRFRTTKEVVSWNWVGLFHVYIWICWTIHRQFRLLLLLFWLVAIKHGVLHIKVIAILIAVLRVRTDSSWWKKQNSLIVQNSMWIVRNLLG